MYTRFSNTILENIALIILQLLVRKYLCIYFISCCKLCPIETCVCVCTVVRVFARQRK